ncbi:hypothetical protein QJS66_17765 [Kocuria rhizophila]|nr:hypothetical protein QJS66_17765 [Kocuria rhizophila]
MRNRRPGDGTANPTPGATTRGGLRPGGFTPDPGRHLRGDPAHPHEPDTWDEAGHARRRVAGGPAGLGMARPHGQPGGTTNRTSRREVLGVPGDLLHSHARRSRSDNRTTRLPRVNNYDLGGAHASGQSRSATCPAGASSTGRLRATSRTPTGSSCPSRSGWTSWQMLNTWTVPIGLRGVATAGPPAAKFIGTRCSREPHSTEHERRSTMPRQSTAAIGRKACSSTRMSTTARSRRGPGPQEARRHPRRTGVSA